MQNISDWYQGLIADGTLAPDAAQAAAVRRLHTFADELLTEQAAASGAWATAKRWLGGGRGAADGKRGLYLHGGVGRGKSFLMDGFYLHLPLQKKLRVHFHQFMRHLHADMKSAENQQDPLAQVAAGIHRKFSLICFDEFHVSDIADAMLLGRLLDILLAGGTRFVMTSNYAPAGLYPNGLARDRFLPAIALLEKRLTLVALDGECDYRQRALADSPAVFAPWPDAAAQAAMQALFARLASGIQLDAQFKLGGRRVAALARASDCIWFDFAALCRAARAKADYLQLAERYATVFLSDVPRLDAPDIADAARRFTWLVDILYDAGARLVLGAAADLDGLYGDAEGGEFGRTLSRLREMQSAAYGAVNREQ